MFSKLLFSKLAVICLGLLLGSSIVRLISSGNLLWVVGIAVGSSPLIILMLTLIDDAMTEKRGEK